MSSAVHSRAPAVSVAARAFFTSVSMSRNAVLFSSGRSDASSMAMSNVSLETSATLPAQVDSVQTSFIVASSPSSQAVPALTAAHSDVALGMVPVSQFVVLAVLPLVPMHRTSLDTVDAGAPHSVGHG